MLTIAVGHDVGYLTGAVGGGRENYYTGAVTDGEPPGRWYGAGADDLGLTGQVDAELMEAIYAHLLDPRDAAAHDRSRWGEATALAPRHRAYRSADEVYADLLQRHPDADAERRVELRAQAERSARKAVSFLDLTFSAPKSVTTVWAGYARAAADAERAGNAEAARAYSAQAREVEEAVMAGARATLDYLQEHAGFARAGHHGGGAGRWVDSHRWIGAQFLQHDSRDRDPQLHVHQAVLNRAESADGVWRTLDSKALHVHRGAAAAHGVRVTEARLAMTLGLRFDTRPDGKAREVVGVPKEVMDLFSSRTHKITARAEQYVAAYRAHYGREPSNLERARLGKRATMATRAAKSHDGELSGEQLDRWDAELRAEVGHGLAAVVDMVLDRQQDAGAAAAWSERDVIERALAAVAESKSAWTRADLTRAVSDALPGHLGLAPERVGPVLQTLTDRALEHPDAHRLTAEEAAEHLPAERRRADGSSQYANPSGALYATTGQLSAERAVRAAAVERGVAQLSTDEADRVVARFAESGRELGADQAAALRGVLTSGARVEVLAAAAGTGKSFTVGALAEAWAGFGDDEGGRRVFGLAPSQVATEVLDAEGLTARNTARWLATQARLDQHPTGGGGGAHPDASWRLRRDDLVVVDEAGMTSTGQLAEVQRRCAAAGAKLLLVGDTRQLGAVGPGGALSDLAERGLRYELAEVRRFAEPWEGPASLRLRDGGPDAAAAVEEYGKHGRLVDGGTAEQAETAAARAWLADTLAGRESLLLVPTNEQAARVSAAVRADLVALGRVEETGVPLAAQGTVAGIGDVVQARRNGWDLLGVDGNTRAPINRETYRVVGVRDDGGLTVEPTAAGAGERVELPGGYVAEHVVLGYASTVHAAQGRTVDTAHAVLGPGTDAASAYVALTRGRDRNTAWTVTRAVPADAETGETHDVEARTPKQVLRELVEAAEVQRTALREAEDSTATAESHATAVDRLAEAAAEVTAGRAAAVLDRLAAEGALSEAQRLQLAADDLAPVERLLRTAELAGHDPRQVLADAVADRSLDGARSPAQVVHARIRHNLEGQLAPRVTGAVDLVPRDVPESWRAQFERLVDAADHRRHVLGAETAAQQPAWALDALGPVPDGPVERAEWESRAGWAAAARETVDHHDDTSALGAAPPRGLAEKRAVWTAAHDQLDLPDSGADVGEMTDGQLRVRRAAYEREQAWAPPHVADELEAAAQAEQRHAVDAKVWSARADVTENEPERERLRAAAAAARAEVETLAQRRAELEQVDQARAVWRVHTAVTRDWADRADAELKSRGVDVTAEPHVTAPEWDDARHQHNADEDAHRQVRDEYELADVADARTTDVATVVEAEPALDAPEQPPRDIRTAPAPAAADSLLETAVGDVRDVAAARAEVERAQAALAEIRARDAADAARAAEEAHHEEELRWTATDVREHEGSDRHVDDDGALQR